MKEESSEFTVLQHKTLAELEEERLGRIKYGVTGVTINGKEVGYRAYRQYYKQFLSREVVANPREGPKALGCEDWRNFKALCKPEFQKITAFNNHR
jgi:hypothetical protein